VEVRRFRLRCYVRRNPRLTHAQVRSLGRNCISVLVVFQVLVVCYVFFCFLLCEITTNQRRIGPPDPAFQLIQSVLEVIVCFFPLFFGHVH